MTVILTDNPADRGNRNTACADCACDCQCACPTDGAAIPVLSLPAAYYLELTPECNNACPGCGNVFDHLGRVSSPPLDVSGWKTLISSLAAHAQQFKLTGGEPTLHPDFEAIARHIDALGIPFTLFTNGRWHESDSLLRLLSGLAHFEGFLISLHGPDAAAHEAFSGVPGSFEQTAGNIRRAVDAGLDVSLSVVVNRENFNRIEETLDLALHLGANHLVVNRLIGAPLLALTPDEAQLRRAMAAVELLRAGGQPIRFGNCIPHCFEASSSRGCTAGSTFATVDAWGRLRPCNHAPLIAGDLTAQPVEVVWHSAAMRHWRGMLPDGCAACAAFAACHGGCRAQAMLVGAVQDPLIAAPLSSLVPSVGPELRLWGGLCPVGAFVRCDEPETIVLLNKGAAVPVSAARLPWLDRLDGALTLRQIQGQCGTAAVDWIGALHQEGMIAWR
ncbi:MAG: radical SAM protein [Anaerolineae bacterium]|nr:radical SAM protein [Anaerolineae bacterium]